MRPSSGYTYYVILQDHEELCCAMCASTLHRKCQRVQSIEEATKKIKGVFEQESLLFLLVEDLEIIQHKRLDATCYQEKIGPQLENIAGTISTETS